MGASTYICAPRFLTRTIAKKQRDFVLNPVKATVTNAVAVCLKLGVIDL